MPFFTMPESAVYQSGMLRQTIAEFSAPSELTQPPLWIVAVLFFGVGDLITTTIGVSSVGITEAGPVTALLMQLYGLGGIVLLKILVFGSGYCAWRTVSGSCRVGIPLGLSMVGIVATVWNLHILALAFYS